MTNLSLTSLIQKLRDAGFSIGVEQILAAEDLLLLMASGNALKNPKGLSTRFAPIFSQNPREQQQFYALFDEWLNEEIPDSLTIEAESDADLPREELQNWGRFSDPRLWGMAGLLTALLGFVLYTGLFREPVYPLISLRGVIVDSQDNPIPFAEVSLTTVTSDYMSSDSSGQFEIIHQQKEQSATLYARAPEKEQSILNLLLNHPPDTLYKIILPDAQGAASPPEPIPTSVVELRQVVQQINVLADSLTLAEQPTVIQRYYKSYYRFFQAGAVLLPLFFLLGWFLLNLYRRRLVLQRKTTREKPLVERLMIRSAGKQLFRNLTF
ncbi:MAG: carboxypeptidase-like regulatory domain-containing protein, partial [Calditrichota bacterium]